MDATVTGRDASAARVRLPDADHDFLARARRLEALSADSPAGPFLAFLARVARGQHAAATCVRVPAGPRLLERVPLDHLVWQPGLGWREMLAHVLSAAEDGPLPDAAADAIARLRRADPGELDAVGAASLSRAPADLTTAPLAAAALQAYFARLAGGLDASMLGAGGRACPACGADPVAGTVDGNDRHRELCCGLCGTRWHATRVLCVRCHDAAALSYYAVENELPGVEAEACDACGTYVKLFDLQTRPDADPVADDAATVVLDVMMAERGYARAGPNLVAPGALAPERRD